jgi:hypothetical protein
MKILRESQVEIFKYYYWGDELISGGRIVFCSPVYTKVNIRKPIEKLQVVLLLFSGIT